MRYRITRRDGGYDSGWKSMEKRITEELPLKTGEYNFFAVEAQDKSGKRVSVSGGDITISQGKYSVGGQTIPEDISLEKDSGSGEHTECVPLFKRGTVLPSEFKGSFSVNKTVIRGSDDGIDIRVLQGPGACRPNACLLVGCMRIPGKKLSRDIFFGASMDIHATMDESQTIIIRAHLPDIDQSFEQVFSIGKRTVDHQSVGAHLDLIEDEVGKAATAAEEEDDMTRAKSLREIARRTQETRMRLQMIAHDDTTDSKYQIEAEKQRLAQDLDRLTSDSHLRAKKSEYESDYATCEALVEADGNDSDRQMFLVCEQAHPSISNSNDIIRVNQGIASVNQMMWGIKFRNIAFLRESFKYLVESSHKMNDQGTVAKLIAEGKQADSNGNSSSLRTVNFALWALMPNKERQNQKGMVGFN